MATILIETLIGKTDEQKKAVVEGITDIIYKHMGVPKHDTRIIFLEVQKNCVAQGGKLFTEKFPP
jgi:4-oxalocrotonate tautomerase family enzyme